MNSSAIPYHDTCVESDDSADDLTRLFVNLYVSRKTLQASAPPPQLQNHEDEAESISSDADDEIQATFGVRRSP